VKWLWQGASILQELTIERFPLLLLGAALFSGQTQSKASPSFASGEIMNLHTHGAFVVGRHLDVCISV
jgi:hypothetical protein